MTSEKALSRRRLLQRGAAAGGGLVIGGPLAALAARSAHGRRPPTAGYGPLAPTPAQDSGIVHLALPAGFGYRVISREQQPSTAYVSGPATGAVCRVTVPTPGIFDGMGAFRGPHGTTVLVRNHENRQRAGEIPVIVPAGDRYDANPAYVAGNTRLVVDARRNVVETVHVLGGTSTNCAGGQMPWDGWIACEETFVERSATTRKHGYCFEVDARSNRPSSAVPITGAGCFAHEAVAFHDGVLYETEDDGKPSGFYRFVPDRRPRAFGDLATARGPLQAIKRRGVERFDADTAAVGESFGVEWVTIPDPDPPTNTVGLQGVERGMILFSRLEGCWVGGGRIVFDSTSGGATGNGQIWEYDPRAERLTLVFDSPGAAVLQRPDNVVVVPHTGDVWVQEDGAGTQFVRGVTRDGELYDVARTILNDTELCGGCFAPDGRTFFLNQQGERNVAAADVDEAGALTYAIWGPFGRRSQDDRGDDRRRDARRSRDR